MTIFSQYNKIYKNNGKQNVKTMSGGQDVEYDEPLSVPDSDFQLQDEGTCNIRRYFLHTLLVLSLLANICMVAYFATTTLKSDADNLAFASKLASAVQSDTVCTSCEALGVPPGSTNVENLHSLRVLTGAGAASLCCLSDVPGLRRLLELFSERSKLSSQVRETKRLRYDSGAHLYMDRDSLDAQPPKLRWSDEYGYGSAYRSRDVTSQGRGLHVNRAGTYHVYSFLTFKTHPHQQPSEIVCHNVNRNNVRLKALGDQVILFAKKTLPASSEKFVTSYLSATVKLRKNDTVTVNVSDASYVYRFAPSNFFGLYYIGE